MTEEILHKVDGGWLLGIYGPLLTEKQQQIASLYFEEDYSLAEIASQLKVSRQNVHETLQRVDQQMRQYEEKLKLRTRLTKTEKLLQDALSALPETDENQIARDAIQQALIALTDEEENDGL